MFSCLCRIVAGQTARRHHLWSRIAFLFWLLWEEIPGLLPWCPNLLSFTCVTPESSVTADR